jgi:hypothetical protein
MPDQENEINAYYETTMGKGGRMFGTGEDRVPPAVTGDPAREGCHHRGRGAATTARQR